MDGLTFDRGSILIPLGSINTDQAKVEKIIAEINQNDGINVYCLSTGDNKATDLGSFYFSKVEKPRIAILTEDGVNGLSAGQVWHLLDTKYKVPFTLLPIKGLGRVNLDRYNVIILPNGNYQDLSETVVARLQDWLASGNTLIAFENANSWLSKNKLISAEFEKDEIKATGFNYENSLLFGASREVPGSVFETKLDLTHPINYGISGLIGCQYLKTIRLYKSKLKTFRPTIRQSTPKHHYSTVMHLPEFLKPLEALLLLVFTVLKKDASLPFTTTPISGDIGWVQTVSWPIVYSLAIK